MGLITSGTIGAQTMLTLDDSVVRIRGILDAAEKMNLEIIVLYHASLIVIQSDARFVVERVNGVHGFCGASSIERLPVEVA
jgi:predicted TIM-barrel enzyme